MRIAYLFSRYPIVSQTFVDTEILALERLGVELEVYSIYPPPTSFRHGHATRIQAPIHYAPPQSVLKHLEQDAKLTGRWPKDLVDAHERKYGPEYKAALRARNALYFADVFAKQGISHFHVHFANRAAHTALFLKAISKIPFSMSTHGQDYMVDLGNHDLLREICGAAAFVANETTWSMGELCKLCPDSEEKMSRVFNGMDLSNFPERRAAVVNTTPKIVSVGRLIEFKGFHVLIAACAQLKRRGLRFECEIIGEGPWRDRLQAAIDAEGIGGHVKLTGALPQEEIFQKLQAADIFTLPCIVDERGASDVFPTVILEAMASSRPVVSTRIAGVPEQVIDGETGFICEPNEVEGLANALEKLLHSPDLRVHFGEAGRMRVKKEFAVENTVRELHAQFKQHVRGLRPPPVRDARLATLAFEWPMSERHESEFRQLTTMFPGSRGYVIQAGALPASKSWKQTMPHLDFLPDGMVIEAEWQQERALARQVETWRGEFGQKLSSEVFLKHARYALYLRHWIKRDGVRHLLVLSSRELLTAWILHRLCKISISVCLEEKLQVPTEVVARMTQEAVGIRVADERMSETLFPKNNSWQKKGAPKPFIIVQKTNRAFEKDWIEKLRRWSDAVVAK